MPFLSRRHIVRLPGVARARVLGRLVQGRLVSPGDASSSLVGGG